MVVKLLIVVEHLLEAVEVEAVANVLFVYSAKKLMVLKIAKPRYPAVALLGTI